MIKQQFRFIILIFILIFSTTALSACGLVDRFGGGDDEISDADATATAEAAPDDTGDPGDDNGDDDTGGNTTIPPTNTPEGNENTGDKEPTPTAVSDPDPQDPPTPTPFVPETPTPEGLGDGDGDGDGEGDPGDPGGDDGDGDGDAGGDPGDGDGDPGDTGGDPGDDGGGQVFIPPPTPDYTAPLFPETPRPPFSVSDFIFYLGRTQDSYRSMSSDLGAVINGQQALNCDALHGWFVMWVTEAPGYTGVSLGWYPIYSEYRNLLQEAVDTTWDMHTLCESGNAGAITEQMIEEAYNFAVWAEASTAVMLGDTP